MKEIYFSIFEANAVSVKALRRLKTEVYQMITLLKDFSCQAKGEAERLFYTQ